MGLIMMKDLNLINWWIRYKHGKSDVYDANREREIGKMLIIGNVPWFLRDRFIRGFKTIY